MGNIEDSKNEILGDSSEANKPRVLVIIPAYNEAANISRVIQSIYEHAPDVDILVINDGSRDGTAYLAEAAQAQVVSHPFNMGYGAACQTGFKYAYRKGYDYVIQMDGDGQHDPLEIPTLLDNVMNNGHDISIGFRYGSRTEMPRWRRVGKRVLDYTTSMGTGGFVTDSQCGFRAFNKKAVETITPKLKGDAFSVESEQLIKAHEAGLNIVNTNVTCKYKDLKTSTKNPASHGLSVLGYVIWVIAERRPLLFISLPGFVSVIIGVVLWLFTSLYPQYNFIMKTQNSMISSILIIVGAFAMFIGLLLHVLPRLLKRLD